MWILPLLFFCPWLAFVPYFLFCLPLSLFLPCLSHLREDFSFCLACDLGGCSYVEPLQILPNQSVNVSVLVGLCVQPILQLAVYGYPDALLGASVSSLAELVFSCWFCHLFFVLVPAGWAGVSFLSVCLFSKHHHLQGVVGIVVIIDLCYQVSHASICFLLHEVDSLLPFLQCDGCDVWSSFLVIVLLVSVVEVQRTSVQENVCLSLVAESVEAVGILQHLGWCILLVYLNV